MKRKQKRGERKGDVGHPIKPEVQVPGGTGRNKRMLAQSSRI